MAISPSPTSPPAAPTSPPPAAVSPPPPPPAAVSPPPPPPAAVSPPPPPPAAVSPPPVPGAAAVVATPPVAVTADWPGNWRELMSGGDPKRLKELERYATPAAVDDARIAARTEIDTVGLRKPPPPADAAPEVIAAYRAENGIPETPDKYDLNIPGLVLGDADKPLVDSYLASAHARNRTPAQVKEDLAWWHGLQQEQLAKTVEADGVYRNENLQQLGVKYGAELKRNLAHMDEFLDSMGLKQAFMESRDPAGRPLGANAKLISAMIDLAHKHNPITSVGYSSNPGGVAAANTELEGLRKQMGDPNSAYNKGPKRHELQQRYRDLLVATGQATKD